MEQAACHIPQEVLTHMLQYVDLQQRLGSCSHVCRPWRTAAAAATTNLDVRMDGTDSKGASLECWLDKNGSNVSSLCIDALETTQYLELPYQQLQQLQHLSLRGLNPELHAPASSSSSSAAQRACGSLSNLTSLTSLQMEDVNVSVGHLAPMSELSQLRRLQLVDMDIILDHHGNSNYGACVERVLARLAQLTHLTLRQGPYKDEEFEDDSVLAPLSGLQQLQELRIGDEGFSADSLAYFPPSLTLLEVQEAIDWQLSSSSSSPQLAQLTGLKELAVRAMYHTAIHPEVLSSLVQLTRLALTTCWLLPGEGAGTEALLGVLPLLTQLQHLELTYTLTHHAPAPAAYSALVPTALTYLDLRDCTLPAAALQAMFPAAPGRQLPALRVLHFGCDGGNTAEEDEDGHIIAYDVLDLGGICSLVSCCPGLQQLWLAGRAGSAVQPGVQITALQQLTGLTALQVGGAAVNDEVAEQVLAQLTALQQLCVFGSDSFTDAGLVYLSCLKQLHTLGVHGCALRPTEHGYLYLVSQASPPDVWQQLHAHVKAHFIDSNAGMRGVLTELESQLKDTAEAAGAKGTLTSVLLQLGAAKAQLANSLQKLDEARTVVAELQEALEDIHAHAVAALPQGQQ